jgi:pyruvate/2-oxoglutarate/acetoin dehydrogenase E1 component
MTLHYALEAAQKLAEQGIEAEVIDVRSLIPLDKETIIQSVKKTHRLVIVDEDYLSYGLTAEIAAIVAEHVLYDLAAPIRRIAVPDVPIPYSRPLEQFVLPNSANIKGMFLLKFKLKRPYPKSKHRLAAAWQESMPNAATLSLKIIYLL